jgi:Domain of unknown function (DUF4276)
LKRKGGIDIAFFETPQGDRKESVLRKVPVRAVNILLNETDSIVVALPDLYPKNKGFPHETFEELEKGIIKNFEDALRRKGVSDDKRLLARFRVFCFKYDLEALVLAAEEALMSRLGLKKLDIIWKKPVEEQNHNRPPKFVVEDLFKNNGDRYEETVDTPLILSASSYSEIMNRCPQCFKPFVLFLENLPEASEKDSSG